MKKIVILGGGASGLVSSIFAKKVDNEVILIDKNNDVGKKILITGNGKCNYFNEDMSLNHYFNSNIESIINDDNINKIKDFFHKIGIVPRVKNGYYYPYSNQAISIKEALKKEAIERKVKLLNNTNIIKIEKKDKFYLYTEENVIKCDKLILATGSCAYPKTGSDGFGYKVLSDFGLNIIKPLPALVQLESDYKYQKDWSGIRVDALLSLYEDNKLVKKESGELLLTNYGISGICTFNLSGIVGRGLYNSKKEEIIINFVNMLGLKNEEEFIIYLENRNKMMKNRKISDLLDGLINYKLVNILLGKYKNKKLDELSKEDIKKIASNFYSFKLNITGTKPFDNSQTVSGGLDLKDINLNTMETKIKDLFVVGELLDVYGECGGYNLAFSFITGMIAGENID